MADTCAGASIFQKDLTTVRLSTATDDPVNGDAGKKSCFGLRDGRKFQVRYNEADVNFRFVGIGDWFVLGQDCQAMLSASSGEYLRHV